MSKYEKQIIEHIKKNKNFILPKHKQAEILNRLKDGLKDLSVSRTSFKWGIPIPFDSKHIAFVWFDALSNYLSGIDYGTKRFEKYWPADIHLIGKDIVWHHTVIWGSMLSSVGIKLPKTVLVHGFINLKGEKLSKAAGRIINPIKLVETYGADALRYYVLKDIVFGEDGDFSEESLKERNNELADKLGNLVSRLEGLAERAGEVKKVTVDKKLIGKLKLKEIEKKLDNYELDKGLNLIMGFIDECNKYVQEKKVWQLKGKELNTALYTIADSLRVASILLHPFIPETAEKILKRLNEKDPSFERTKFGLLGSIKIKKSDVLFRKIK